jgi:hypothetical protein
MKISDLLPVIHFDESLITSEIELFQNHYLRSILKFHDGRFRLLLDQYCIEVNPKFNELTTQRKKNFKDNLLLKNQAVRQLCIGMVIAYLEEEQFQKYLSFSSEINPRIIQMLRKRIADA